MEVDRLGLIENSSGAQREPCYDYKDIVCIDPVKVSNPNSDAECD